MPSFWVPRLRRAARFLAAALLGGIAAVAALGEPAPAAPGDPWHAPAFSLPAPALLSAARAAAAGSSEPVLILLAERRYAFDPQGRRGVWDRLIYRIGETSAVEDWSSLEAIWAPWHEEQPRLRARVVTSDGVEHPLDPKTIAEEGSGEGSRLVYGDRRLLRAPLPSVAAGAVIEREIVTLEKEPLFDAGRVSTFHLDRGVPVLMSRLEVEAPRTLDIKIVARVSGSVEPRRREIGDRIRLIWELPRREPKTDWEASTPSDSPQASYIAVATGHSWGRVAERYGQIVETQIAGADLRDAVREAVGKVTDRREVMGRLLAWLQKRIRYTGVEFNNATIVPRTPAETLKRSYGDCKDKAALLVALLRQAGIPAFVALLKAGPGPDVEKSLFGFGTFDHAIVYVPGTPEIWIDPTETFARVGQLPSSSQDRLALVARPSVTDLLRTPADDPAANRRRETREFFLSEHGHSRLVETTEVSGSTEIEYRHSYAEGDPKETDESLQEYARSEYLAHGAVKHKNSDTSELSQPFRLTIEIPEAARGTTDDEQAIVAILPSMVARAFPTEFRGATDDSEEDPPPRRAQKPRKLDYVFTEPFVAEWEYRIHPPPGFRPAPLPESEEQALGTARLSRKYVAQPDGTVVAELRVDVVKRRLTSLEFEKTREAVSKLASEEAILIRFDQIGQAYLQAGQIREALAEFRRLAATHPKEALHRTQVATSLLAAGLGESARAEALQATALEPKSSRAWRTLGWVRQHDVIGRRFGPGFVLADAIQAYRKAKELDSSDVVARGDLAILLEHDSDGVRYGKGADLGGAIDEYRAIEKDLKNRGLHINLCLALMRAGRFAELAEAARGLDPSSTRSQFLILAAATQHGARAGLEEASRLISDAASRRDSIETVGHTLVSLRRYPEAAAFFTAAVSGAKQAAALRAQADMVSKARRYDEIKLDENDPKSLFFRLMTVFFGKTRPGPQDIASLVAEAVVKEETNPETSSLTVLRSVRRTVLSGVEGPLDFVVDLALASVHQEVEGDEECFRVRATGAAGVGSATDETFFLIREKGAFRLLASDRDLSPLGPEALRKLERGKPEVARRMLDWARDEVFPGNGDDPLSGSAFAALWTKGSQADTERMRLAAAVLSMGRPDTKRAIAAILASRSSARTDAEKDAVDRALTAVYIKEKEYAKALGLVERLAEAHPQSPAGFRLRMAILSSLNRKDEARRLAQERLDRMPEDPDALRSLFLRAARQGEYADAEKWGRRLIAAPNALASDYNSLAWIALFPDRTTLDHAIEDGRRAVDLSQSGNAAALHTLATLYAETGRTNEARELILKSLDVGGRDEPDGDDWYVFGRIAEQYGETAAAVAAYRKVTKPSDETVLPESTYLLAAKRLKSVGH